MPTRVVCACVCIVVVPKPGSRIYKAQEVQINANKFRAKIGRFCSFAQEGPKGSDPGNPGASKCAYHNCVVTCLTHTILMVAWLVEPAAPQEYPSSFHDGSKHQGESHPFFGHLQHLSQAAKAAHQASPRGVLPGTIRSLALKFTGEWILSPWKLTWYGVKISAYLRFGGA